MRINAKNVKALAEKKFDENHDLRQYLKWQTRLPKEELDRLVSDAARRVESCFDCTQCANCCKELSPTMAKSETERLAARLGLTAEDFRRQYLEDNSHPEEDDDQDGQDGVRRKIRGMPCPFLKDDRCTVYEDRPEQCRKYPYLHEPKFSSRTLAMIERTFTCPIVYRVFEDIKPVFPFRRGRNREW